MQITMPVAPANIAQPSAAIAGPKAPLASDSVIDQTRRAPVTADTDARAGRQDAEVFDTAARRLLTVDGNARIVRDAATNAATFVSGDFGVATTPGVGGSGQDRLARTFLLQHGAAFGITDPMQQLKFVGVERDDLGMRHFKFQQMQAGLPVFGQQLVVHAKGDTVSSVGGRITPNIVPTTPSIDGAEAARRAIGNTADALRADGIETAGVSATGPQKLGWYTLEDGTPRLAYELVVGASEDNRWQMYVDAKTGDVLDKWSLVHSVMNRETADVSGGGRPILREGSPPSDKPLDAAHEHAKDVYDFYNDKFGRDSIDGKGMKLRSNVHYGTKYNNAFWNGTSMTYGDGDGVTFIPFSLAADVVAHEMTHGVTERSAGLRYQRQSGALNESWSDVFGNLIEKWAEQRAGKAEADPMWRIGEDIFTPKVDGDALRSMSNPGKGYDKDPQPAHMKDYKETSADNGGVHINSGIPNKAAYETVMAIGQDKTSDIWYRALTKYLTPSSQFKDAANYTVQSAIDLYGAGSAEALAVAKAWDSVGLLPGLKPGIDG